MGNTAKIIFGILIILIVVLIVFMFIKTVNNNEINKNNNIYSNQLKNENSMSEVKTYSFPGVLSDERIKNKKVIIETNKGNIEFVLYPEDAPKTVSNFVYLTEEGYYNGLTFHRVVSHFVIQGGDPEGTGSGGPGYKFADETVTKKYDEGIVAMANSGPNTNGSQFFIMLADNDTLPPAYTIFGKVTSGIDVVKQIVVGDVMNKVIVEAI